MNADQSPEEFAAAFYRESLARIPKATNAPAPLEPLRRERSVTYDTHLGRPANLDDPTPVILLPSCYFGDLSVAISGLVACTGCNEGGLYTIPDFNGVYRVPWNESLSTESPAYDPLYLGTVTITFYGTEDCSGDIATTGDFDIYLKVECTSNGYQVEISSSPGALVDLFITDEDNYTEVTNIFTACDFSFFSIGHGGTATLEPWSA